MIKMKFGNYQCPVCKKINHGYFTNTLNCVFCGYIWNNTQTILFDFIE